MKITFRLIISLFFTVYSGVIFSQSISPSLKDYLKGLENRNWLKAKLLEDGLGYWFTLKLPSFDDNNNEGDGILEVWGVSYIKNNDTIKAITVSISESFYNNVLRERECYINVAVNKEFGSDYITQLKSDINKLFPTKEAVKHFSLDNYYLRYSGYPNEVIIEIDKAGMDEEKEQWSFSIRYLDSD